MSSVKYPQNLLAMSIIIFPVHRVNHWITAAVNIEKTRIEVYDSLNMDEALKSICRVSGPFCFRFPVR